LGIFRLKPVMFALTLDEGAAVAKMTVANGRFQIGITVFPVHYPQEFVGCINQHLGQALNAISVASSRCRTCSCRHLFTTPADSIAAPYRKALSSSNAHSAQSV
jgi:hypothetical protein